MGRLAHFRDPQSQALASPGSAGRLWPGNARKITPFPSRTVSYFEVEQQTLDTEVPKLMQPGTDFTPAHYASPPSAAVRPSNMQAVTISDPAPFGSYFRTNWSHLGGARANLSEGTRRMTPLANPNARGKAEGQPLQAYNPWPSASQLSPIFPGAELKAV